MTYTSWVDQAACAGLPTEWWYPEPHQDKRVKATALWICRRCPVQAQCLAEANRLEPPDHKYGIWGGAVPAQRQVINNTTLNRREREKVRRRESRAALKEASE